MAETMITLYYNEDVRDEFGPINSEADMLQNYCDFLNEIHDTVTLLGVDYDPSRVLEETDPIAFRSGFLDYCDSWEEIDVPFYVYMTDQERAYIVASIDGTDFEAE